MKKFLVLICVFGLTLALSSCIEINIFVEIELEEENSGFIIQLDTYESPCNRGDDISCISNVNAIIDGGEAISGETYSVNSDTALLLSFSTSEEETLVEFYSNEDIVIFIFDKDQQYLDYVDVFYEGEELNLPEGSYSLVVVGFLSEDVEFIFNVSSSIHEFSDELLG